MIYAVADCNFYTDEHEMNNYVYFTHSIPDAIRYVKDKFDVDVGLHEPIVYNDEDDEYGERYVLIEEIKVHGEATKCGDGKGKPLDSASLKARVQERKE